MIRIILVDDEPQSCKALAIKLKDVEEDIEIIALIIILKKQSPALGKANQM